MASLLVSFGKGNNYMINELHYIETGGQVLNIRISR
jgi:hypothetical protein